MKKPTQAEVRRRDMEIEAGEKEIEDLKNTPKPLLDDLEQLKLMRAEGKKETFEERMRRAPVEQRKRMMAKGGSVKSSASKRADGCAVKGKTKGKMV